MDMQTAPFRIENNHGKMARTIKMHAAVGKSGIDFGVVHGLDIGLRENVIGCTEHRTSPQLGLGAQNVPEKTENPAL